jgi:hypothetical protein
MVQRSLTHQADLQAADFKRAPPVPKMAQTAPKLV